MGSAEHHTATLTPTEGTFWIFIANTVQGDVKLKRKGSPRPKGLNSELPNSWPNWAGFGRETQGAELTLLRAS